MSRLIDRGTIDRIFAAANIVDVISEFVTLKKRGVNYISTCPFHDEKTPSFVVSPSKALYKCFGCGKGGNVVSFIMEHEGLSYPEALRMLAQKYNIPIEEYAPSPEQQQVNDDRESMMVLNSWASGYFKEQLQKNHSIYSYFTERGFTKETIDKFDLGFCPKGNEMSDAALKAGYKREFLIKTGLSGESKYGDKLYDRFNDRVIFPIHSLSGRVLGFGGRTLRSDKNLAKYLNSPESEVYHKSQTLYGIYHAKGAITRYNRCILVEGYTDVIQMHQAGVDNVVATSGTALTEEQIRLVKRFTNNVTVIYDGDAAGIKASLRGIDMLLKEGLTVRSVMLPEGDDPDSFARSNTSSYLKAFLEKNEVDFITFKTNILLKDAEDDPIKRAELINDIISSIAVITNAIERQVFIRECSRLMDVSEGILQQEVYRKMIGSVDGGQWYESIKPRREYKMAPPDSMGKTAIDDGSIPTEISTLEGELMQYLIKYGEGTFKFEAEGGEFIELPVARTILDELENLKMEFQTPLYKRIYELYLNAPEDELPTANELVNGEDTEIASFVTDIQFSDDRYSVSEFWQRSEHNISTERERLTVAIPKTLSLLFLKIVDGMIAEKITELDELSAIDLDDNPSNLDNSSEVDVSALFADVDGFSNHDNTDEMEAVFNGASGVDISEPEYQGSNKGDDTIKRQKEIELRQQVLTEEIIELNRHRNDISYRFGRTT